MAEPPVGEVGGKGGRRRQVSAKAAARRAGVELGRFNAAGLAGAGVAAAGGPGPPAFHLRAKGQQPAQPGSG